MIAEGGRGGAIAAHGDDASQGAGQGRAALLGRHVNGDDEVQGDAQDVLANDRHSAQCQGDQQPHQDAGGQ